MNCDGNCVGVNPYYFLNNIYRVNYLYGTKKNCYINRFYMWYNFTQLCRFKRNHFINVLNGPIIALINLTPLIKLPCSLSRLKSNPDQVRQTKYNLLDPQQLFFRMSKRDKQKTKNKTK